MLQIYCYTYKPNDKLVYIIMVDSDALIFFHVFTASTSTSNVFTLTSQMCKIKIWWYAFGFAHNIAIKLMIV